MLNEAFTQYWKSVLKWQTYCSKSCSADGFHPSRPKGLNHGFWYLCNPKPISYKVLVFGAVYTKLLKTVSSYRHLRTSELYKEWFFWPSYDLNIIIQVSNIFVVMGEINLHCGWDYMLLGWLCGNQIRLPVVSDGAYIHRSLTNKKLHTVWKHPASYSYQSYSRLSPQSHTQTLVDTASATIPYLDEPRQPARSPMAFSLPTVDDFDAIKPGHITHQLKQAVSKPGHVNNLYYWFVHLKVNCCYKIALIGWHPIKIVCKATCTRSNQYR